MFYPVKYLDVVALFPEARDAIFLVLGKSSFENM